MNKCFCLLLLLTLSYNEINSQILQLSIYSDQNPSNCTTSQYFDIILLTCQSCPLYSLSSLNDPYNCRCNGTSKYLRNNGGSSINCSPCPSGLVQSFDGWDCVAVESCTSQTSYLADTDQTGLSFKNGSSVDVRKCIQCDPSTIATSSGCISCYPFLYTDNPNLNISTIVCSTQCQTISTGGGICLVLQTASTQLFVPTDFTVPVSSTSGLTSWFFSQYAATAYYQCRTSNSRNSTACQLLLNMCTLIYNIQAAQSSNIDVCYAFRSISDNTKSLPILDLSSSLNSYLTASESQVSLYLTFNNTIRTCQSNSLSFVAAKYKLNGNLISYSTLDLSELEICNLFGTGEARPSSSSFISINYQQSCTLSVNQLIQLSTKEPVFYDLYLRYKLSNGSYALLPVPTVVTNYLERGSAVNTYSTATTTNTNRLNHRFFLVDQYTTKTSQSGTIQYIRYAKSITILFNLFNDNSNTGRMYPPIFYITYDSISTTQTNSNSTISPSFSVSYVMILDTQINNVWISIGVISFFGLLWAFIRSWVWNKRSGKLTLDAVTIGKFIMYLFSSIANVFFVVFIGVCIWWLIFFKGQNLAYILLPVSTQIDSFTALLVIAFVFKAVDILYLILVQVSYDVFVIDWEKPKVETGSKGSVSCWRTLFVVNEWNEIQTYRKTNVTIQLIFTLLFLKVVNLEAICTADCNTSINVDLNTYKADYSSILRVGMAASIYLALGIIQWIIYRFIYSRCVEDKLGQFVDFCSVANVSVFILTHAQYGYYIHGKSPNGSADTNMKEMVMGFEKEEKDLVAKRGLLPDRQNQVFSISITNKLRNQYSKVMQPLYERRALRSKEDKTHALKQVTAYEQLNRFLTSFINHSLRDLDYIVTKRNFIENLFDLEFRDPAEKGYFYEDESPSFQHAIFAGKERSLFIFDLILFLFVDYFAKNYVLAAFVVYLVSKVLNLMREDLGKMNLSRKTLVDRRFLI